MSYFIMLIYIILSLIIIFRPRAAVAKNRSTVRIVCRLKYLLQICNRYKTTNYTTIWHIFGFSHIYDTPIFKFSYILMYPYMTLIYFVFLHTYYIHQILWVNMNPTQVRLCCMTLTAGPGTSFGEFQVKYHHTSGQNYFKELYFYQWMTYMFTFNFW